MAGSVDPLDAKLHITGRTFPDLPNGFTKVTGFHGFPGIHARFRPLGSPWTTSKQSYVHVPVVLRQPGVHVHRGTGVLGGVRSAV